MEKKLNDLKAALADLDTTVLAEAVKHPHHGKSATLLAARTRLTGAITMLDAHAAWLKDNPEPKPATEASKATVK